MDAAARVEVTRNLIALERGDGELLLANSYHMRPLYVRRGRARVKQVMAAAEAGSTPEKLAAAFPGDAALVRLLREHCLLIDPATDRERFAPAEITAEAIRPRQKKRILLYLLVSERCNLDCVYCLNGPKTYQKRSPHRMSLAVALRSVKMCLEELSPGGAVAVAFFGGEPLLQWPLVKQVIRHCERELKPSYTDKHIQYHLTSNLTVRPPDLIDWVRRYDITIVCGVDGPAEIQDRCRPYRGGSGSHARTAETIRQLVAAGARLTLRATITAANCDRLAEVAAHHTELGGVASLFIPVRPVNSDQEFFPEEILPDPDKVIAAAVQLRCGPQQGKANLFPFNDFSPEIRPGVRHVVACAAPYGGSYVVRMNGDVYPCIYLVGQKQYRLGNVAAPLDRRPLDKMLRSLHVDQRADCQACVWRYACGGGCPVMNLARLQGAEQRPGVVEYSRRITCGLSQAILADVLWGLADKMSSTAVRRNET